MRYAFELSLEYITLVKIASILWNQSDIRAVFTKKDDPVDPGVQITEFCKRKEWPTLEKRVTEKISQLPQPERLKEKLLGFVQPIGREILKWIEYHNENQYFGADVPKEFCWTSQGIIDKKRTAKEVVKDEGFDIIKRYRLACIYCLEDDIEDLWNKMSEYDRSSFYDEDPRMVSQEILLICCTYYMKGEIARLEESIERKLNRRCSLYLFAFEKAAESGNKPAVEYFFEKLTPMEREENLIRITGLVAMRRFYNRNRHTYFPKEHYIHVLCFLFSQMDEEQQAEVFKNEPSNVLICFLDWPWQNYFLETASCIWNFLSEDYFYSVLMIIIDKVKNGYRDCNYRTLFGEFWEQSPDAYKTHCIRNWPSDSTLLSELLSIEDKENVRLILKYVTLIEKERMMFRLAGMDVCKSLIYRNEWDLLSFFIQECIPSKDVLVKFKKHFWKHIVCRHSEKIIQAEKDMWNTFFQLLDDLIN